MKMTARARLTPWTNISRTMSDWEAFDMSDRPCTCHPDDNPPRPCPQKYALTECREAADKESLADEIERLRAERDAWEGTAQWHYKEAFALRARLAEAVAAVQAFADHFGPLEDNHMLNDECRHCFALARGVLGTADSADERPACDCKTWEPCKAPLHRDCKRLTSTVTDAQP